MQDNTTTSGVACPTCGAPNLAESNFCENCGASLKTDAFAPAPTGEESLVSTHRVGFATDIGYSHHVNQDAGGAWTWTRQGDSPASLVVVADGVSAGRHSEGASELTVELIHSRVGPVLQDANADLEAVLSALLAAAKDANVRVAERPHDSLTNADATTLVVAACIGGEGAGVWCGDSRVYELSAGTARRLTRDHSWAEAVVSQGMMSEAEAAADPRAHMITRWLGPPAQEDPGLEVFRFRCNPGDIVLCCTDGLYMYFAPPASNESEMAAILAREGQSLQTGLDELVNLALRRGGKDNITAGAIQAS